MVEPEIRIEDYNYNLTDDKIAKYPLECRDASRILIFRDNSISESKFANLTGLLPEKSLLIFNNTRVVPARLIFRKETGAFIEIFCLEPYTPTEYNRSFSSTSSCSWKAVVGNAKRWKSGEIRFDSCSDLLLSEIDLRATVEDKIDDKFIINFRWSLEIPFSQVMELCGKVPIPPYLHRESKDSDRERYQTLYAKERGSVAAPTAGLHFTERLLEDIDNSTIERGEICLHVGAGTFIPVKSRLIIDHKMHSEPFSIEIALLRKILIKLENQEKIVAVGTTTVRTLESLYYLGVQCKEKGFPNDVSQWEPYNQDLIYSVKESIMALINWMESENIDVLERRTEIIIVPGYNFKLSDVLITNFHQPQSTLLLLISAFIGDKWRAMYEYALKSDFRFLSYGDSSILFR
ncbi:MAG: S-adenosylmethionine:tRNA ribosyltransferase-isomerase [Bacteroidales bacterium]|nr:S-adenosylmethionine:tRNA ribosyltransferase-isomerase [Bacteroidales bacterium]